MPFTFSHPAIVLPLTLLPRHWISVSGLVIGSITPDFEYFLRMRIQSDYSHTISGLFWFDVPLGLLLAFVFHNIVRDSLFDNLPTVLQSRLATFKQCDWNRYFASNWLVVIFSILLGAASHILWDSFTHDHGYFVQTIPALSTKVDLFSRTIPTLKIVQHGSTFVGGLVVAFALFKLPSDKSISAQLNIKYWSLVAGLTLTIITIRVLSGLSYKQYGHLLATGIAAVLIALTLTPLLTRQKE